MSYGQHPALSMEPEGHHQTVYPIFDARRLRPEALHVDAHIFTCTLPPRLYSSFLLSAHDVAILHVFILARCELGSLTVLSPSHPVQVSNTTCATGSDWSVGRSP